MKKTGATIILAALLAVLLAAGCKGDDEPDETAAERYVVMGGRLVLYSGNAANVIVPDGTASIGNNAFKGCARLENVFIPASVTYIAGGAFRGVNIGHIAYGDTVARWEEVVAGSSGLAASLAGQSVVCIDGVWNAPTDPGDEPDLPTDWQITTDGVLTAYTGSNTHVIVSAGVGVTTIAAGAFAGTDVTAAELPASVTRIEPGAFTDGTVLTYHGTREEWERLRENGDLTGLTVFAVDDDGVLVGYSGSGTHVTIPDGVTAVGAGAFAGHTEITDVTIPKSVTAIGDGAFKDCTGLTGVTVPGSVTSIGAGAFGGCTGLTDVTILGGVQTIGTDAFKGCTGLTDVTLPASVTDIGGGAFEGCDSLTNVTYGGTREELEELVGGSGMDLSDVTVTISDEASTWDIRDGVLVGYYGTETDITIPDGVTAVGEAAFAASGVTAVTIPEGVKHIGDGAFQGCGSLTHVEIPLSMDSIGYNAFAYCDRLETIAFAGAKAQWRELSKDSGMGDDVIVTCSDGIVPETVYVRGADAPWYTSNAPGATASDDNPGTRTKPFATIQKAIDTVIAINDGSSPYTIYIDGTLTHSEAVAMATFTALKKELTLTIQALSGTATLDANGKSRVIKASPESGALNLTLENLVITGGNTTGNGGGIYYQSTGGTLEMTGCEVIGCEANYGGGVFVYSGTFTMGGGEIAECTATNQGGGVFINSSGTFNMSGTAKITGCKTTSTSSNSGGGGIYNAGTLAITGGLVSDCTSAARGGGVYVYSGTFTMGGSASVPAGDEGKNDVYLASGKTITVAGALTAESPVATITPSSYAAERQVLSADGTGVTAITQGICNKFKLTPASDGTEWKIVPDGMNGVLATTTLYVRGADAPWYASNAPGATASDDNPGTRMKPFATIQKAVDAIIARNDGTSAYTIYLDGTFTATSADALADFDALSQKLSVKIAGLSASEKAVLDGNGMARGIIVGNSDARKDVNLTLENLTVQNAAVNGITLCCQSANSHTIKNCDIKNNAGRGIYKYYGSLDLQDCEISRNFTTGDGGGVYVYSGTFKMSGGTISGNGASNYGGGIYIDGNIYLTSGTFEISGGTITGNTATQSGGGVYVYSGTFKMSGGTISGNESSYYGGGIYVNSRGRFEMSGGTIGGNTATYGGGIYVNSGTFTMSDGTISGNEASYGGGGVSVSYTGTFTMSGGTVSGNKASNGGGVSVSYTGTFTMSGAASVPAGENGKNDVDLSASGSNIATITVSGDLTAESPVATITPYAYTAGRQVLSKGAGVTAITQDICDKFALTPASDGATWEIAPNGTGASGVIALRTYTFKVESGGTEIVEGSELPQSATITLSEVRRDGVALIESDGTFLIEMTDGYYSFASIGLLETSATGLPATISLPPLPPSPFRCWCM